MNGDIIIYAVIAAGLVFWLRSILGTRHGDERQRPNPFTTPPPDKKQQQRPAIAGSPLKALAGVANQPAIENEDIKSGLERHMSVDDAAIAGLREIEESDRSFDLPHFARGAQDAFVMIVEGFATGDRELLEGLLGPSVFGLFKGVIDDRDAKGEKAAVEIHAVRKVEIKSARLEQRRAFITVKFVADETNVVRAKDGGIISGNPDRVKETIDIWTFSRDVRARDPAWLVVETQDVDAAQSNDKTVPDSK